MQDSLPASSNSESDILPSPSHSPSPAISNSSTKSKSLTSDSKSSNKKKNKSKSKKKKKKKKKTVLVFLSPNKSKSSRSLFTNIKKKRRNSKLLKTLKKLNTSTTSSPIIIHSAPTTPVTVKKEDTMANVNHLREEYEAQQRRNSYHNSAKRKSANFESNIGYRGTDNPYKISAAYYNKQLPPNTNNIEANMDSEQNERINHHRHHKSRSHILTSPNSMNSRSKSPIMNSHSQNINGYNNNKYSGICPHCNHSNPLLDYIIPSNRHSYLAELRDKLAAIESLSSMLKQEILQVQNRSNTNALSGSSDTNLHSPHSSTNKNKNKKAMKGKNNAMKKEVSNPYQNDGHMGASYLLINLTTQQQQSLSLLTSQTKITFPLKGTAMISPQESTNYFDKFKEMKKYFGSQEFFIGLDNKTKTFIVHTKLKSSDSNSSSKTKQYRQIRSFSSLNGAEFESAKDNVLKIWFKNTRGYFLISFASETEANTVLSLVNIIVNNSSLSSDIGPNQLVWASYIEKKGKRMRFYSQKFLCLIKLEIKLYKTHINYTNGEEPSQSINLMDIDLSRDKKEIKFNKKNKKEKESSLLAIKLIIVVERDDFLNLCAQTLGKAIQSKKNNPHSNIMSVQSPSNTMCVTPVDQNLKDSNSWNLTERDEDMSGTDAEDSEFYEEKSTHDQRGYSINDGDYIDDSDDLLAFKSMTMTLRGPPQINLTNNNKTIKHNANYLEMLNNTPRMYGAGLHKALDRLAQKRPSDIDFIEIQHSLNHPNTIILSSENKNNKNNNKDLHTFQLLDVLGKSMINGAFLNKNLYLHKAVWEQNKVMVVNYEKKLEIFTTILSSLDQLFKSDNHISIDWLKSDFKNNCNIFHQKLIKCEKKLREIQTILTDMIIKSKQKAREKGAAKLLHKFKDKAKVKVFDNQPYRDLIYKICGHASSMQLYYLYLNKITNKQYKDLKILVLNDIKGITLCMNSFGNVVIGDVREYLFAYLRRGSKNIYQ